MVQPFETDSSHVVLLFAGQLRLHQRRRYCDGGLMAEIEAVRHPDGRMTYTLDPVPVWVAMPGYRIVPPEVGDTMAQCRRPIPVPEGRGGDARSGLPGNPNSRKQTMKIIWRIVGIFLSFAVRK